MTVRQKINDLQQQNPNLKEVGVFKVDKEEYAILKDTTTGEYTSVRRSQQDLDENDKPVIIVRHNMDMDEFLNENLEKF